MIINDYKRFYTNFQTSNRTILKLGSFLLLSNIRTKIRKYTIYKLVFLSYNSLTLKELEVLKHEKSARDCGHDCGLPGR